jgi:hypothetical protein
VNGISIEAMLLDSVLRRDDTARTIAPLFIAFPAQ